eukprot:COSAG01_NODE_534_length_15805_cov_9.468420_2_plen_61_part_00
MADLELVAGRLFYNDADKAIKVMGQFATYKSASSNYKSPMRRAAFPTHCTEWSYWDMFDT